jgi:hypothetical protein
VTVGSHVRLLALPMVLKPDLPADEWVALESMLGEVFQVIEVDEYGRAEVEKWWDCGDGVSHSHSLWLDPHEMERAEAGHAPPS